MQKNTTASFSKKYDAILITRENQHTMKILLINSDLASNRGDRAIAEGNILLIRKHFPEAEFAHRPDQFSEGMSDVLLNGMLETRKPLKRRGGSRS